MSRAPVVLAAEGERARRPAHRGARCGLCGAHGRTRPSAPVPRAPGAARHGHGRRRRGGTDQRPRRTDGAPGGRRGGEPARERPREPSPPARVGSPAPHRVAHHQVPETDGMPPWIDGEHDVHRWCRLLTESGVPADRPISAWCSPSAPDRPGPDGRGGPPLGAGSPARRWPLDRWASLASALAADGLGSSSRDRRASVPTGRKWPGPSVCRRVASRWPYRRDGAGRGRRRGPAGGVRRHRCGASGHRARNGGSPPVRPRALPRSGVRPPASPAIVCCGRARPATPTARSPIRVSRISTEEVLAAARALDPPAPVSVDGRSGARCSPSG